MAGDRDQYDVCAGLYLAIYNQDPAADVADQMLYNAALMFEQAGSMSAAVARYEQLIRQYPKASSPATRSRRTAR